MHPTPRPARRAAPRALPLLALLALLLAPARLSAQDIATAMNFEDLSLWEGLLLDYEDPKEGRSSGRWENTVVNDRIRLKEFPRDVSSFDALVVWVYSQKATQATIAFALFSENEASEGSDYYLYNLQIGWEGWKEVVIPFEQMKATRQPIGLHQIDYLRLASTGFNCGEPHAETLLKFDAMRLMDLDEHGRPVPPKLPVSWQPFDGIAMQAELDLRGYALVYVRSDALPICQEFESTYLLSEEMRGILQGRTIFFVEASQNPIVSRQLDVFKVPAFVLVWPSRPKAILYISDLTNAAPILDFFRSIPALPPM